MPFDDPSTRIEIEVPEEIRILDLVAELLATPDRWCQGVLIDETRMCLHGATLKAFGMRGRGNYIPPPPLAQRVAVALHAEAGVSPEVFNDTHTHAEVLALIARARKRFEET